MITLQELHDSKDIISDGAKQEQLLFEEVMKKKEAGISYPYNTYRQGYLLHERPYILKQQILFENKGLVEKEPLHPDRIVITTAYLGKLYK